jgi:GntR family transcriptional repressor for pyruvate dehydrogenase complex
MMNLRSVNDLSVARRTPVGFERQLVHATLLDRLAEQIEERIVRGDLADGDKLPPEGTLAEEYGVSRPLVREALAKLRARGYLETITGRGTFVRHPDAAHLAETFVQRIRLAGNQPLSVAQLYEARAAIETTAAGLAAQRADTEAVAELGRLLQHMRDCAHDPSAYTAADVGFHVAVAAAAGNPLFPTLLAPLVNLIVEGMFESHAAPEAAAAGIGHHARILARIEKGDAAGAARAMRQHLEDSQRLYPDAAIARASARG